MKINLYKKTFNKVSTILIVAGFALFAVLFSANAQYDVETVSDSGFSGTEKLRAAVLFEHDSHNENANLFECDTCHHVMEDGQKIAGADSVGMECSECHLAEPGSGPLDLIRAYHLQCRECHLEEKSGPIFCGECHRGAMQNTDGK